MNTVAESRTYSEVNQTWSIVQISSVSKCIHCDNPLAINGHEEQIVCNKCTGVNKITNDGWIRLFKDIKEDLRRGKLVEAKSAVLYNPQSSMVNFLYRRHDISCPICEAAVIFGPDTSTNDGTIACTSCSNKIRFRRASKELKHGVGGLHWIVGEELSTEQNQLDLKAQNLIQKCPSCGAGLSIDGQHRIVECSFCLSKVTLSEEIWNRLNPSKARKYWYLVFSGFKKSERDLAIERAVAQRKKNRSQPQSVNNESYRPAPVASVQHGSRSTYQVWLDQGGYFFIFLWGVSIISMLIMYNQDPLPLNLLISGQQTIWEQAKEQFSLMANGPLSEIDYHPFYILLFLCLSGIIAVLYFWYIKKRLAKGWSPPLPNNDDD